MSASLEDGELDVEDGEVAAEETAQVRCSSLAVAVYGSTS